MNQKEILVALKAGKLSLEEAKRQLVKFRNEGAPALPNGPLEDPDYTSGEVADENIGTKERDLISSRHNPSDSIAIVGMSGRYAGAANLAEYQTNLKHGINSVKEVPQDRWDMRAYYKPLPYELGKIYCKWMGALDGIKNFDSSFFGITPLEAEVTDPQQRLFLEEAYKAFEDAGYSKELLSDSLCGVYLGIMSNEYGFLLYKNQVKSSNTTGNSFAIAAARISYFLNLKGPAIPIDTACSSSLVSAHLGCQALRSGEVDMALVGGVTLYLSPESYMGMCSAGMLSPEGKCKSFDNDADGFVPGEGVGALVLKRLKDAERDNDHIYGLIVGSGINQDGKTNGITAPSMLSQVALEDNVYKRYNINPESIGYVEMHGTGTKLGDPIELEALSTVFSQYTDKKRFCGIGSVKSNIGHTSAAAGVASIQKVMLSLRDKELYPSINFKTDNQHFDIKSSPFYVNSQLKKWDQTTITPRRAAISSFGFSGTNAHLIVEEYIKPSAVQTAGVKGGVIIVLSAKKEEQLINIAKNLQAYIENNKGLQLENVAFTLQVGRDSLKYRLAMVVETLDQLSTNLLNYLNGEIAPNMHHGVVKKRTRSSAVQTIDLTSDNHDFNDICKKWIHGAKVEWQRMPWDIVPQRVSLPTYPFAKNRCWFPENGEEVSSLLNVRKTKYLTKNWKVSELSVNRQAALLPMLILATSATQELAMLIADVFDKSLIVIIDEDFVDDDSIMFDSYSGVIDLIGFDANLNLSTFWMTLVQRQIDLGPKNDQVFLCLTQGLEDFNIDQTNLSGANHAGLYQVLQREYSKLRSMHLDMELGIESDKVIARIISEISTQHNANHVCYRNDKRYISCIEESLSDLESLPNDDINLQEDQVVLITGGTRGIGALCALHLVENCGVKKIALTGRIKFPQRSTWEKLQREENKLSSKISSILKLEALGARVEVYNFNLKSKKEVEQGINTISSDLGPIGGVLHCAGIISDTSNPAFIRKSPDHMNEVLAPKVLGVINLCESFIGNNLKYFVLFSSISSAIPRMAVSQLDYALANSFMDYASSYYKDKLPLLSIQWANWKEVGMGEIKSPIYDYLGFVSHTNIEGLQCLDELVFNRIHYGTPILAAVIDEEKWDLSKLDEDHYENVSTESKTIKELHVELDKIPSQILAETEDFLLDFIATELKMNESGLEKDDSFQDLGVDSILMAQLSRSLNETLKIDMDPSILFEYSSVEELAGWLSSKYPENLTSVLNIDTQNANIIKSSNNIKKRRKDGGSKKTLTNKALKDEIVVVGMSCKFPGANNIDEYWDLLSNGQSAIRKVPQERWESELECFGGFIDNPKKFNSQKFLLEPNDAAAMDPQALLLLEESWNVLKNAGYEPEELKSSAIGVYIGGRSQHAPKAEIMMNAKNPIMAIGQNFLAANISQFYDFTGPSLVIDTACSSSLVGLNFAVKAIRDGDIEGALVGGVSVQQGPEVFGLFGQRGLLNVNKSFHAFDERANGIIVGEGVGMVFLKSKEAALANGDYVYGSIKGLSVNNDGRTAGVATPNIHAQKSVMRNALSKSGLEPNQVEYLETNASGTQITDLLELRAVNDVYGGRDLPLSIGSIKPNIGHPLCAEGIASLIKVLLMLDKGYHVPFLSGQKPLKHFNMDQSALFFERDFKKWSGATRYASLNCFADGGTNVHVVLESWTKNQNSNSLRGGTDGGTKNVDLTSDKNAANRIMNARIEIEAEKTGPAQLVKSGWKNM